MVLLQHYKSITLYSRLRIANKASLNAFNGFSVLLAQDMKYKPAEVGLALITIYTSRITNIFNLNMEIKLGIISGIAEYLDLCMSTMTYRK